jgi:hypothetical protein
MMENKIAVNVNASSDVQVTTIAPAPLVKRDRCVCHSNVIVLLSRLKRKLNNGTVRRTNLLCMSRSTEFSSP